jgi:tRNA A-37 threonylcarbamoyl transferase component Bud32
MAEEIEALDYQAHKAYFREVLQSIHQTMAKEYRLHDIAVMPCASGGSRLSIPIRIEAVDREGEPVKLFAKILGSSEMLTAKVMQMFKNIFLKVFDKESLFDANASAEEMARHQYQVLKQMHEIGIPTAKPLGCHRLVNDLWLLVEEFLEAATVSEAPQVTEEDLETAFRYLAKMQHEGIYHGDIKPENIMFSDHIYIIDVGNFMDDAPEDEMAAYDLASMTATLMERAPPERVVALARRYFSKREVRHAAVYIELMQRRPDFNISNDAKEELMALMSGERKERRWRK